MLNIVLFGGPGAGKGTQSKMLIEKYNLVHLSTGDILREEKNAGTELGMKAKALIDSGKLVPDQVVIDMIDSRLESNKNSRGFIFDGFPRTIPQAEALDKLLVDKKASINMVLALEVGKDELVKRLQNRGKDSGRADDQDIETIEQRIKEYNDKTAQLKNYYTTQNKLKVINGVGTIDSIFQKLCEAIDKA